jgi:hypothetical protein
VCDFSLKVPGHGLITPHKTIVGWKHKFEASGCVTNLTLGAPTTANIEEKEDNRRVSLQSSPHLSGRQIYHVLGVCRRRLERTFQNVVLLFIFYIDVCIYIYIHTHIHTHTRARALACVCVCVFRHRGEFVFALFHIIINLIFI